VAFQRALGPVLSEGLAHQATGTSAAAAMRRLRKDRPDIHARALAGGLSAHAGMIEAGVGERGGS
jgi:hypothetical protein